MKNIPYFLFTLTVFLSGCFNTTKTMETDGGIKVSMEINFADFVNKLSNNPTDSIFQINLQKTTGGNYKNFDEFISSFTNSLKEAGSSISLSSYFSTFELKDKISSISTDEEVIKVLNNEFKNIIEKSKSIIAARIEKFIDQTISANFMEPNIIQIEIPGISDKQRITNFIQASGNLGFWETYDNTEVFQYIESANKKLAEMNFPDSNSIALTQTDSSILNQLSNSDEKVFEEYKRSNPLFAILYPNVDNNGRLINSAVIGLSKIIDTASVNKYLSIKSIKNEFPYNLVFLWTAKPIKNTDVYQLIGIKITSRDRKAPLDGTYITDAKVETGDFNPQILISMNSEGANIWKRLTKENIGKQIAIVLDNQVYSFPIVNAEIEGGKSAISGDFTIEEASDLVNILTAGCYPINIKIKNIEVINPKK